MWFISGYIDIVTGLTKTAWGFTGPIVAPVWDGWRAYCVDQGARLDQPWQVVMGLTLVAVLVVWRFLGRYLQNIAGLLLIVAIVGAVIIGEIALVQAAPAYPWTAALLAIMVTVPAVGLVVSGLGSSPDIFDDIENNPGLAGGMLLAASVVVAAIITVIVAIGTGLGLLFGAIVAHPIITVLVLAGISTVAALWLLALDRIDSDPLGDPDIGWFARTLLVLGFPMILVGTGLSAAWNGLAGLLGRDGDPAELEPEGDRSMEGQGPTEQEEVATLHQMFKAPPVTRPDDDPDPAS